jgi:predicted protein tyrosine phosphatase
MATPAVSKIYRPDKWLFICSANIARSPTAEYLARRSGILARSCGTGGRQEAHERYTVTPMTREIVCWADVIVCMKEGHRLALEAMHPFNASLDDTKKIFVWALDDKWGVPYHPEMIEIMEPKLLETQQLYEKWLEEKAGRSASDATAVE